MWPFSSPASASTSSDAVPPSQCPVDHGGSKGSRPSPTTAPAGPTLSKDRILSSIPRWTAPSPAEAVQPEASTSQQPPAACPAHSAPAPAAATAQQENWVYPSPSSFYTALERKSKNPDARDMNTVVNIHNIVNERVWVEIQRWEKEAVTSSGEGHAEGIKLVSFIGKSEEPSPRARMFSLLGYAKPFDRHDWTIDRPLRPASTSEPHPPSKRIRYVIDFYNGRTASAPPNGNADPMRRPMPGTSFYLDVRPAVDDFEGVRMRARRLAAEWGLL